jgi:Bacterial regulatory proteins, luxR family
MAQKLALRDYAEDQAEALSAREFEVLQFLARGLSVKEIADALALNAKTIANHRSCRLCQACAGGRGGTGGAGLAVGRGCGATGESG